MGKSCIRFRKVEDLAMEVIADTIRATSARAFIASYEAALKRPSGRKSKPSAVEKREPKAKTKRPRQ